MFLNNRTKTWYVYIYIYIYIYVYIYICKYIYIYNPNSETEQVATLHDLDKMLETIKDLYDKHIVLTGDFNFFFDTPQVHAEAKQL